MNIQFASQSYRLKSLPASSQRCLNFYAEKEPKDAKSPLVLFGAFGLTGLFTVGNGPIRGMHVMNNVLYVVSGNQLYSVNSIYNTTYLGTGIVGFNVVSMSDNGMQICIVNGAQGYIYDTTTSIFQRINSTAFYPANTVTYFDGYFIFDKANSNEWFYSGINNGLSYNGLDFYSATVSPTFILATINQQQNLLIFKQDTIETWIDSGNNDSPFQRYNGATVERGCAAPLSIIKEDNSVFFLGNDRIAYRLDMNIPKRISTSAIEQEWQTYTTVGDCQVFKVTFEGHKFLFWNFPTANRTWVYDIETQLWHERVSFDAQGNSLGRYRGNCSTVFNNLTMIGDAIGNQIGTPSSSVYTEYGTQIIGILDAPPIHNDRKRIFFDELQLDCETGVGLTKGQGSNPQIMLNWSDDGGRTFSETQQWRSLGVIGAYQQRLRWTRLGQARQRVFRVTVSDPVRRTIISARADLAMGDM